MLSRTSLLAQKDDHASNDGRRSRSGASTASHETSTAADSGFDTEVKYAPIPPQPQPMQQDFDQHRTMTPTGDQQHFGHPGFDSLHRYNTSQGSAIDPQLGRSPGNRTTTQSKPEAHRSNSEHSPCGIPGAETQKQLGLVPSRKTASANGPSAATDGEKKERKAQGNNQANEKELRELIEKNYHRTLESIARDVRNAERTQKSEKAKQLFAMRWCVLLFTSVV